MNPNMPKPSSFMPEDYVARTSERRANILSIALFGCVMGAVTVAFVVTNRTWAGIRGEQLAINEQYANERKKIEQLDLLEKERSKMLAKAEVTTVLLEKIPRSVLLAEVESKRPDSVTVEEFELASKRIDPAKEAKALAAAEGKAPPAPAKGVKSLAAGAKKTEPKKEEKPEVKPPRFESTVRITGMSRVYTDITDFASAIQSCPLLDKVELVYIKDTTVEKTEFHKFEILASIKASADARALANADRVSSLVKPKLMTDKTGQVGPDAAGPRVTADDNENRSGESR